jgi:hypothetical protein
MTAEKVLSQAVLLLWKGKSYDDPRLAKFIKDIIIPVSKHVTTPVLYTALHFIQKLSVASKRARVPKSEYTVFLASLIIADVTTNDNAYSINSWCKVSGFSRKEIIAMRREILELLEYNIVLSKEAYEKWVNEMNDLLDNDGNQSDHVDNRKSYQVGTGNVFFQLRRIPKLNYSAELVI